MAESTTILSNSSIEFIPAEPSIAQSSKPKLSRTSTQKVRTGCITCKKRHIKCDEATPQCNNCLKSRGHCEGYVVDPSKKKTRGPVQLCWDSKQVAHDAPPRMPLQIDQDSLDFRDATSMLYFQEFVGLAQGPWMSATSSGDLWGVTLPQLARNKITLRHAAMAIGALSIWHHRSSRNSLRTVSVPALPTREGDAHYFHAVAYYCHSLKLQSSRASVQDAVFLSVLSLFFETLRGNRKAALDHVNHGLALLLALLTDVDASRHIVDVAPNPKPLLGAVADIFTHLAAQARAVLRSRIGHGTPLPNFAKGLRKAQHTMESFMVVLSNLTPPRSRTATIDRIPPVFATLDEFETYWAAARRHQTTMAPITADLIRTSNIFGSRDDAVISNFYADFFGNERVAAFCSDARAVARALDAAFLPLFNRIVLESSSSSSSPPSPTYLRALHLRLQLLGALLFEDLTRYLSVATLHALTPLFREYLSLASAALRALETTTRSPAHALAPQSTLASHLLALCLYCRDPLARADAVALLRAYPGQDGLWDTRALCALAERSEGVERANAADDADEGEEERWRRLWRREMVFEEGGRRVVLRFLERGRDDDTGEEGCWRLVEEVAEMGDGDGVVRWERRPVTGSGGLLMADLFECEMEE